MSKFVPYQHFCRFLLIAAFAVYAGNDAIAQCGADIDLGTWVKEGIPANGNWIVTGGGDSVEQVINGDPTFYVSPDSFINVLLEGNIRVNTTGDDDWVGFVFGYNDPDSATPANYDFYIFAWKQLDQNFGGFFGSEGYTLAKVSGPVANLPQAFSSFAGPFVTVLGTQYGNTQGWNDLQTYAFALTYTNTRTVVAIAGDTIFDVYGCFPPGRFGFYNYSQSNVIYSNFHYQVAAAFEVLTPQVCLGDTAVFQALSDSCTNAAGVPVNNTITGWDWDFGDGGTSTDTNGVHVYTNPGTYTVRLIVTDYLNCADTAFNIVTVLPLVTIDPGNDTSICPGASITFDAGGGMASYLWQDASTAQTIVASAAGTYMVTVVDTFGCASSDTVVLSIFNNPVVNFTISPNPICPGDSATLSGTGAATYQWPNVATLSDTIGTSIYAFPVASTVYTVTGTDANGCTATRSKSVNTKTVINPSISPANPAICPGQNINLTVNTGSSFVWDNIAGLNTYSGATVSASPAATTTYTVTATGANGCTNTASKTVTVKPLPTIAFNPANPEVCLGGSRTITASGATTYTWSPTTFLASATGATKTITPTSSITYTVTGVLNGCSNSDTVRLKVNPLPVMSISPLNPSICRGDSQAFTASGAPTITWNNAAFLTTTSGANTIAFPTTSKTFVVTGTDANGCTSTSSSVLTVNTLPTASISPNNITICAGTPTALTAASGASYAWANVAGLNTYTGDSVVASPVVTSTYVVTVTSALGCTKTASRTITVKPLPVVVITPSAPAICIGNSVQMTASGATSYVWSPVQFINSPNGATKTSTPTSTITYTVKGNLSGCIDSNTVTVTVNPLPTMSMSPTNPAICFGDDITLGASGAPSIVWNNTGSLSAGVGGIVIANPTTTTTYTVTGTDVNGCTNTASSTLTVHALPTVDITVADDSLCVGDATAMLASGAFQYAWSSDTGLNSYNTASVQANPAISTTYTVTGTDINGCFDIDSAFITVSVLPVVTVNPTLTSICDGQNATFTAAGAQTYSWSPVTGLTSATSASVVANPNDTTLYTVIGTDTNQCSASASAMLNVTPLPNVQATMSDSVICRGKTDTLYATGANSYQWTPVTSLFGVNTPTAYASPPTTRTYYVIGTGPGGCTARDTVTVAVYTVEPFSAGVDTHVCKNDSVMLNASGGVSYEWEQSAFLSETNIANPLCFPPSSRFFSLNVTDANGCVFSDAVYITVEQLPVAAAGSDKTICIGKSVAIGGNPTGPIGASYQWAPAIGLSNVASSNPIASPSTTTTYSVLVTSTMGCEAETEVVVEVNPLPDLNMLSVPISLCYGDTAAIRVTGGYENYQWIPSDGVLDSTSSFTFISPPESGVYTVIATDANGCTGTASAFIQINALPVITNEDLNITICELDTVQLTANGGLTYLWSNGDLLTDSTISNPLAFPTQSTDFEVEVTDSIGCSNKAIFEVKVYSLPYADAGEDIPNCNMQTVTLGGDPSGAEDGRYEWSPAELLSDPFIANPTVLDTGRTMFYLTVYSAAGCMNSDSVYVNSDCYESIFVPNAFTPDGDGINDVFRIVHRRLFSAELNIYDRWGHIIYTASDLDIGWNGAIRNVGEPAPIDVYHWTLIYETESGRVKSKQGKISLIR